MRYFIWRIAVARHYFGEKILMWVAWHLPKSVVYWCAIRLNAHASTGTYENELVTEMRAMDALERWRVDYEC